MVRLIREIYHIPHSWKDIKANQLRELYIAMMIRTLGISLIGVFVPIYLYQLGFSVQDIALFFIVLYGTRLVIDNLSAWLAGYFGPKHTMILSHVFQVLAIVLLLTLSTINWPLAFIAVLDAVASSLFFTSYHIEFSKIQTAKHAGAEIGNMIKLAKLASAVGPLLGGIIATVFSIQVSIVLALAFILSSAIPLALSPEPVRRKQHITTQGFPLRDAWRDIASNAGMGIDQVAVIFIWPLFVALFILTSDVYLLIGLVTSIGLLISFLSATLYGREIDAGRGKGLLSIGVLLSSIAHLLRPFVSNFGLVVSMNVTSDLFSIAMRMPYVRGLYGAASSYEGYRNVYIALSLFASNLARLLAFVVLFIVSAFWTDKLAMQAIFLLAAIGVWMVTLNRFKAIA